MQSPAIAQGITNVNMGMHTQSTHIHGHIYTTQTHQNMYNKEINKLIAIFKEIVTLAAQVCPLTAD